MQMNELNHAMNQAKIGMLSNRKLTFFSTILLSLKLKWDETCPTAWVDGFSMGWNPDWFWSLTPAGRIFVMYHEAAHVALDHLGRLLGRDASRWNRACDYAINLMGVEMGLEMPSDGLLDRRFKGMSADQIYLILEQEDRDNPPTSTGFGFQDMREPPKDTKPEDLKRHVESLVIRASIQAKMDKEGAGHIPGEVQLFLDKLLNPKLPWKTLLRREVQQYAKNGYSWMKPNRRFYPDHYLPSRWAKAPTRMRFYVDISGSVEDFQFKVFVSEIAGAMKMFTPKEVTIIQFDHQIRSAHRVRSLRELQAIEFKGRGGTYLGPVLDDIEEQGADLNMVFTDGEFDWEDSWKPSKRILWLINDNPGWQAPCGRAIHFNTRKM